MIWLNYSLNVQGVKLPDNLLAKHERVAINIFTSIQLNIIYIMRIYKSGVWSSKTIGISVFVFISGT